MSQREYTYRVSSALFHAKGIDLPALSAVSPEAAGDVRSMWEDGWHPDDAASELVRQHLPEVELAAMRGIS